MSARVSMPDASREMSHARLEEEHSGVSGIERTFVVPPAGHILRMVREDAPSVPLATFESDIVRFMGVRTRRCMAREASPVTTRSTSTTVLSAPCGIDTKSRSALVTAWPAFRSYSSA